MEQILKKTSTKNGLKHEVTWCLYNGSVYRIEKTMKGSSVLMIRTAKILNRITDWPNIDKFFMVKGQLLCETCAFKASGTLDLTSEKRPYIIAFTPTPELIIRLQALARKK